MLEFVDPCLYFVKDENHFINPLLQVGSGSGSDEKSTGSGRPKINGSDRIRIIIPDNIPYHVTVFNIHISNHIHNVTSIWLDNFLW